MVVSEDGNAQGRGGQLHVVTWEANDWFGGCPVIDSKGLSDLEVDVFSAHVDSYDWWRRWWRSPEHQPSSPPASAI